MLQAAAVATTPAKPGKPAGPPPQKPQGGPGSVFLIDGNNFIYRAFHGLPSLTAPGGTPVNAVHGFVRMVQAIRKDYAPEVLLAVFDHGGPGHRNALYPAYKAQRPPPPEDLVPQLPLIRGATAALGLPMVEQPGVEADDIIATYAMQAQKAGKRVIIVSTDKDLMQLVDVGDEQRPPILLWDSMKNRLIGPADVLEKWGVLPPRLGDLLALTGDSSDNIPGVPGIGPKTAAALLEEFGSLEQLLTAAPTIKQQKRRELLETHAAGARLSRQLVELLRDLTVPPLDTMTDKGPDPATMEAFFAPLGFKSMTARGARAAAAASGGGPLELQPGPKLALDRTRVKVFRAADADALAAWLAASRPGPRPSRSRSSPTTTTRPRPSSPASRSRRSAPTSRSPRTSRSATPATPCCPAR
jgi:DNA polymerase-1